MGIAENYSAAIDNTGQTSNSKGALLINDRLSLKVDYNILELEKGRIVDY